MAPPMQPPVLPAPCFEGSEKRVEVDFFTGAATPRDGLRALSRDQLDQLMAAAACCIVSELRNPIFDSYVLSESSLFVYPSKLVLKTCGTTRLLEALPLLLQYAAELNMTPRRCKYSRASFLFPADQPAPHDSFDSEIAVLRRHFGHLAGGDSAYVLGDAVNSSLQWHIYVADSGTPQKSDAFPTYSLEVCCTGLDPIKAGQFFRTDEFVSAAHTTASSGIAALIPKAAIDDFVFEPCGYSMNGMLDNGFVTIHITPEDGFSYASFELSGFPKETLDTSRLVEHVLRVLEPSQVSVALSVDAPAEGCSYGAFLAPPKGFTCKGASLQTLHHGGRTAFYTLERKAASRVGSPRTVLGSFGGLDSSWMSSSTDSDAEQLPAKPLPASPCPGSDTETDCSEMVLVDRPNMDFDSECGDCKESTELGELLNVATAKRLEWAHGSADVERVLKLYGCQTLPGSGEAAVDAFIAAQIAQRGLEDTFYVMDLGAIVHLYRGWEQAMPRVQPFYAVKCNTNPAMISLLAALGGGFDCASEAEVDVVTGLGIAPDRIVYANACKRPRDIRHAQRCGVDLTTFDTDSELRKLARWHPGTRALLRMRADDPSARCQLGNKYGAEPEDSCRLLATARELGINVVGVSFHVGSGASNPCAFVEAIELSRQVFDQGTELGFDMRLLDIGGGFSGANIANGVVPAAVNAALDAHFPPELGVRIIAEPGRYFAEVSAVLACMVYGTRQRLDDKGGQLFDYWITDGLYGSMNCVLYDHATLSARPLRDPTCGAPEQQGQPEQQRYPSTVFGPTCDGLDTVFRDYPLPKLENGDWLVFPNMGAYTVAGAANFNGFNATDVSILYVDSRGGA